MSKIGRGNFSKKSTVIFEDYFGHKPEGDEARLFAYLNYVMTNDQKLQYDRMALREVELVNQYHAKGYLYFDKNKDGYLLLRCIPEFWEMMSRVLYYAYVLRGVDADEVK